MLAALRRLPDWAAPTAILVVFALITLPRLGTRAYWGDEALTLGAVTELGRTWRETGGTMGLYYAVISPVVEATHDRFWVRLPSFLFVAGAIWTTWAIGRRLRSPSFGALAAGAMALGWFAGRYAMEARGYGLSLLLVCLSWLGLVMALQAGLDGRYGRGLALWAVALALAPLAQGIAGLQVVAQVAVVVLHPDRRRWLPRLAWGLVPLAAVMAGLFSIGAGEVAAWVESLNPGQLYNFGRALIGWGFVAQVVVGLVGLWGIVASVRAIRAAGWDTRWSEALPLLWAAGLPVTLLVISVVRPYAIYRYTLTSLPGATLLIATGLLAIRPVRWRTAAVVAVAVAMLLDWNVKVQESDERWDDLVAHVAADAQPGDALLATASSRAPFDVAWEEIGAPVDLVALAPGGPVGEVARFYPPGVAASPREVLATSEVPTVWFVERSESRRAEIDALKADPAVVARWDVHEYGGLGDPIYLVRFDRRGDTG